MNIKKKCHPSSKKENKLPCIYNEWICMNNEGSLDKQSEEQFQEFKQLIRDGKKYDFGDDNKRIRREMLSEDITNALNRLAECSGTITIQHTKGMPTHMKVTFEEIDENGEREKYIDFIGNSGFVTYKKYPPNHSKIAGEKEYKYLIRNKSINEIPLDYDGEPVL